MSLFTGKTLLITGGTGSFGNAVLIPIWGTAGAALASLITEICSSLVCPLLIKPLRRNAVLMLQAIILKDIK